MLAERITPPARSDTIAAAPMHILAVIPARYGATRFPGKPLADLGGRPIVQWVYEAAAGCPRLRRGGRGDRRRARSPTRVARASAASVEMTRADHPSGTDRVAEVAERHADADVVVNVQGDQPFVDRRACSTRARRARTWRARRRR